MWALLIALHLDLIVFRDNATINMLADNSYDYSMA